MTDMRLYFAIEQKDIETIRGLAAQFKHQRDRSQDGMEIWTLTAMIKSADRAIVRIIREQR